MVYENRQEGGQFGGSGGNYYNRTSNTLTISLSGIGVYRTPDAGGSWVELNRIFSGREETEYAFSADPSNENRMMVFGIYGRSAITIDGTTWKNSAATGFDFGSVDWTDPLALVMIAMIHTDPPPGEIYMSTDGGASWTLKGKWCHNSAGTDANKDAGKAMLHVVNATTFLISNADGIYRSTNSGGSWTKMYNSVLGISKTLKRIGNQLYAGYENGVLVCDADGTNWRSFSGAPDGGIVHGPMFGADQTSMLAINNNGLYKTTNSGATWTAVTPFSFPPKGTYLSSSPDRLYYAGENSDYKNGANAWAWDYRRNIVYVGHMGGPMLKLQLPGVGEIGGSTGAGGGAGTGGSAGTGGVGNLGGSTGAGGGVGTGGAAGTAGKIDGGATSTGVSLDGGRVSSDASPSGAAATDDAGASSGCACSTAPSGGASRASLLLLGALALVRRTRSRQPSWAA